jgi:hypothetical protein
VLVAPLEILVRLLKVWGLNLVLKELRGVIVEGSGVDVDGELKRVREAIASFTLMELRDRYLSSRLLPASMPSNVDAVQVSSSLDDAIAGWLP